jgi:hypothetical protein
MNNVQGLNTLQTVKWALDRAAQGKSTRTSNARAEAFWLLAYSRMTDEARAYLTEYVTVSIPG